MRPTRQVQVPVADGRIVEVLHVGVGDGPVVVCQGGTPSGLATWPQLDDLAEQAGLGLVAYARPGYARSSRREGRTVASAADETGAILDHLGVETFVAFGVSGGGPHALADGAGLPDRCTGAVVVAGLGPVDAPDLDFFDGMGDNQVLFRNGLDDPATLASIAEGFGAVAVTLDAAAFQASAADTLPAVDAAALAAPGGDALAGYLAATTRSAFSHGVHGLTDDVLAFTRPWGFDASALAPPVAIWHGTADENVPIAHGRWLVDHIPGAEGHFVDGDGHVSILAELPAVVDRAAALARR